MHLLHDKPVNGVIAGAGFLFLGLFLMFTLIDFDTRENPTAAQSANGDRSRPPAAAGAPGAAAPAPAAEHH